MLAPTSVHASKKGLEFLSSQKGLGFLEVLWVFFSQHSMLPPLVALGPSACKQHVVC